MALVLLVVSALAARADELSDRAAEIRLRMTSLASADEPERRAAATRLVEIGAVEEVARGGAALGDVAWSAFANACIEKARGHPAIYLNAAAYSAPDAHRRRLLALAQRLDPEVGVDRTLQEIETTVRAYLVNGRGTGAKVEKLGHDAVPFILAVLRDGRRQYVDEIGASSVLRTIAEPEDVPALRELLLGGASFMARPLGRLQRRGVAEAASALIDAVESGRFDSEIAGALQGTPHRARTIKAVRAWLDSHGGTTMAISGSSDAAWLFGKLRAHEMIPLLESWVSSAESGEDFKALAYSLTRLGSKLGVELLIRVVSEKRRPGKYRDATDSERAADRAAGRLPCGGFITSDRWDAARFLNEVTGDAVKVPTHEEWTSGCDLAYERGIPEPSADDFLDGRAMAFRKWWDASKDRLTFDAAAGRWVVGK